MLRSRYARHSHPVRKPDVSVGILSFSWLIWQVFLSPLLLNNPFLEQLVGPSRIFANFGRYTRIQRAKQHKRRRGKNSEVPFHLGPFPPQVGISAIRPLLDGITTNSFSLPSPARNSQGSPQASPSQLQAIFRLSP